MTRGDAESHIVCEHADYGEGHAGRESELNPVLCAASSRFVEVEQSDKDAPNSEIGVLIREYLEQHPHFRGRTSLLQIETIGGEIVLSGRLPSYYLKQLLQEAVKKIPDVAHIDNRVEVTQ